MMDISGQVQTKAWDTFFLLRLIWLNRSSKTDFCSGMIVSTLSKLMVVTVNGWAHSKEPGYSILPGKKLFITLILTIARCYQTQCQILPSEGQERFSSQRVRGSPPSAVMHPIERKRRW